MLELLLIRHGQTDWNAQQKVMGRQPIPLNETGMGQAKALAEYLGKTKLSHIITSPVLRAKQTSEMIAGCQDEVVIEESDALAEIDYGDWINLSFDDLARDHGELLKKYRLDPGDLVLPGGESMKDVAVRVGGLLMDVMERFDEGRVALVSHADVIKIALLDLLELDLHTLKRLSVDNCALLSVRIYPEIGPRLIMYNALNGFGNDM
jgi:broad specificity phosphatase PhoE